jgi:minichromosome maintenance protein 10
LDNGGGGATYVVGGNTINTNRDGLCGVGDEHLGERLGRGRADTKKRLREAAETEKALNALLDKEAGNSSAGGKYLAVIRKAHGELGPGAKRSQGNAGATARDPSGGSRYGVGGAEELDTERKRPFSAGAIKRIGFDPTARRGERNEEETAKRVGVASVDDVIKLTSS